MRGKWRGVAFGIAAAVVAGALFVPTRTDAATTVPSAPRTVKATNGNARVTLSWLKPTYDRGYPITSYVVSGKIPSTGAVIPTVTTTTLSATVTGLQNGTNYTFTVAARNSQGTGASSGGVGIKVGQPGAVSAVTATIDFTSARLTWPAAASNGGAITQYQVRLYQNGVADGSEIFKSAATTQTVTGLSSGGTYTFTVAAKNTYGYGPVSPKSNAVTAVQSPNAVPPAGGYFSTLAVGAALPSESSCAVQVRRSSWEPRTANDAENHAVPPQPLTVRNHPDFNTTWQSQFKP
ncbi:MAG TPA: fibronectin type III domain-containing protein, partial [Acidimicrobiia bacterium]|nr:fibronectin type III domain-containing protein [Acidimicrobiia bacterium]